MIRWKPGCCCENCDTLLRTTHCVVSLLLSVCTLSQWAADLHVEQPWACLTLSPHPQRKFLLVSPSISGRQEELNSIFIGLIQQDVCLLTYMGRTAGLSISINRLVASLWINQETDLVFVLQKPVWEECRWLVLCHSHIFVFTPDVVDLSVRANSKTRHGVNVLCVDTTFMWRRGRSSSVLSQGVRLNETSHRWKAACSAARLFWC